MRKPVRSWMYVVASAAVAIAPVAATSGTVSQAATRTVTHTAAVRHANLSQHMHIDCSTQIVGVFGSPVAHTASPAMHRRFGFGSRCGLGAVELDPLLHVRTGRLPLPLGAEVIGDDRGAAGR